MKKFLAGVALAALLASSASAQIGPVTPTSTDTMIVTLKNGTGIRQNVYTEVQAAGKATGSLLTTNNTWSGTNVFNGKTTLTPIFTKGTAPAPTGTGTPTIVATSTDQAGEVTAGTSATSVVITFAGTYTIAPFCVVRTQSQLTSFAYTISTTAITITQTATSANLIDYVCVYS